MKAVELLDKYQRVLAGLLDCKPEDISVAVLRGRAGYVDIASEVSPAEDDKPAEIQGWCVGKYRVRNHEAEVSTFELYQMPHCCGILVSCRALVQPQFRGKRVGTVLNNMRQDIGRMLGYSLLLCTDIEQNTPQRKLLKTNGWTDLMSFKNRRTNNTVYIAAINI